MWPNQNDTKRIAIESEGPDSDAVFWAVEQAVSLCKTHGAADVVFITATKNNFEHTIPSAVLGKGLAKRLLKGEKITDSKLGVTFSHASVKTVPGRISGVAIALYLGPKDLAKIDDAGFQGIVFLPWMPEEKSAWVTKWNAQVYDGSQLKSMASSNLTGSVRRALESLTALVNLSTGLSHTLDKDRAKQTFRDLKHQGHTWTPANVESYAAQNGWKAQDAAELASLSQKYL